MLEKLQVWGDSIMKGVVYDEKSHRYVTLKENGLTEAEAFTKIQIENYSNFGQTILRMKPRLEKHLTDEVLPDAILIELGGNDCDFNWKEVGDAPEMAHLPKTPLPVFLDTLRGLVDEIRRCGILPLISTLPPLEHNRYFEWITRGEVCREGVLKWLKTPYKIFSWQESYDAGARQVAAELDVSLVDVRSAFLSQPDYGSLLCVDGIHPNEKGQRLIGSTVAEFLRQNFDLAPQQI